jgi:hypothetical protein
MEHYRWCRALRESATPREEVPGVATRTGCLPVIGTFEEEPFWV